MSAGRAATLLSALTEQPNSLRGEASRRLALSYEASACDDQSSCEYEGVNAKGDAGEFLETSSECVEGGLTWGPI